MIELKNVHCSKPSMDLFVYECGGFNSIYKIENNLGLGQNPHFNPNLIQSFIRLFIVIN